MDGRQTPLNPSLQRGLHRWILAAALAFSLLAGGVSGWVAFDEARELQDNQLQQVAAVVATRIAHIPVPGDSDPEDTLILQRLGETEPGSLPIPSGTPDGLHSLDLQGTSWRVCVYSKAGGRFAVSQRTEVRDEVAWGSSLRTALPILLLAPLLMAVASFAVSRSFQPVHALADSVDKRDASRLDTLSTTHVPQEILPFIVSINRLLARLQQAITQQQRFVADAAHELRTPVTALSLLAENLANASTPDEIRTRLAPVLEGLERLRTLVSQLLDLARLQGETRLPLAPVALQPLVQEAIAGLYPLAEAKSIDLGGVRIEAVTVLGQAEPLTALVRNALENAIRYTPEGGRVDVSLFAEHGQAVLWVEDTGCGIPEAELAQVFKPFYRVGNSTEQGNGLGLAISQEIAHSLGGCIRLANHAAGGLRFEYRQSLQPS